MNAQSKEDTSWQQSERWYDSIVGRDGHYYHQNVVLPGVIRLLNLQSTHSLLDLACGQGVLARHIPSSVCYVGIDAAKSLISKAKSYSSDKKNHTFILSDITKPLNLPKETLFSHAAIVLALQNIQAIDKVLIHASKHLENGAKLVVVLNHPCFRIPRQSSWGFDEHSKTQYRKVCSYMSPQKIPIATHPGKQTEAKQTETLFSFHEPLSALTKHLFNAGFVIELIEEWCSDKTSTGKAKSWENRARKEFPLFMAICACKKNQ